MITDDDLFAFCGLSPEEVAAIAEHDHENLILSIAHGETLLEDEKKGVVTIKHYLEENIAAAKSKGDKTHEEALKKVYQAFDKAHPTVAEEFSKRRL